MILEGHGGGLIRRCSAVLAMLCMIFSQTPALAGRIIHPTVVQENPLVTTPQLVATTTIAKPHVDAIGQIGTAIFAGGLFDKVARVDSSAPANAGNFVAFDAATGQLRSDAFPNYKDPVFDGQIWSIATYGNFVFVGGQFTTVNGLLRPSLVKINATTGAVDPNFNANFAGGTVWDLQIWGGPGGTSPMLIVAGSMSKKIVGLSTVTGANTNYFNLDIADPIPNAWGGVSVYSVAINPAGTRMVAVGNFQTVKGASRTRLFVANLTGTAAALDPWYYPGFAKPCSSTAARRIAYLQSADFSPDGSYFVVTATGQIPLTQADIWPTGSAQFHTVCDAAGRFNLNNDQKPVWINYTGGDSVWRSMNTGAAVYVQGHFVWLDNPFGFASQPGPGAVKRAGIGAIDPTTGKALPWDPAKPAQLGGKAFLANTAGLWVGSDSLKFNNKPHRGIAFVPLP